MVKGDKSAHNIDRSLFYSKTGKFSLVMEVEVARNSLLARATCAAEHCH